MGTKMNVIRQLEQTDGYNIKEIKFLSFRSHFLGLRNSKEKLRKHTLCDIIFPKHLHTLSSPCNPCETDFSVNQTVYVCGQTEG